MPRLATTFAAALALILPIGRPLLVGLTPAIGIGAGLLSTQTAQAQTIMSLYESGLEKFQKGDYEGAISDFSKMIKLDPQNRSGYYARAMSKLNTGQYKSSVKDSTKAIKIDPSFARAYLVRSQAKMKLGNIQGAVKDLDKVIILDSKNAFAYNINFSFSCISQNFWSPIANCAA